MVDTKGAQKSFASSKMVHGTHKIVAPSALQNSFSGRLGQVGRRGAGGGGLDAGARGAPPPSPTCYSTAPLRAGGGGGSLGWLSRFPWGPYPRRPSSGTSDLGISSKAPAPQPCALGQSQSLSRWRAKGPPAVVSASLRGTTTPNSRPSHQRPPPPPPPQRPPPSPTAAPPHPVLGVRRRRLGNGEGHTSQGSHAPPAPGQSTSGTFAQRKGGPSGAQHWATRSTVGQRVQDGPPPPPPARCLGLAGGSFRTNPPFPAGPRRSAFCHYIICIATLPIPCAEGKATRVPASRCLCHEGPGLYGSCWPLKPPSLSHHFARAGVVR